MDPTFWATVSGVVVAIAAVTTAYFGLREQLRQNYMVVGAISAIEWRNQIINLHDRGLNPGEIRYIMYLERGGAGYEQENGPIDEIVRNIPRVGDTAQPEHSEHKSIPRPRLPFWDGKLDHADQFD